MRFSSTQTSRVWRPGSASPLSLVAGALMAVLLLFYVDTSVNLSDRHRVLNRVRYERQGLVASKGPRGVSRGVPSLLPTQREALKRLLEQAHHDIAALEEEMPLTSFSEKIRTPYGEVEDRHQIVDEACPRYVTMMKPQHGMGHQIGTFTTTLITALFFNLTVADAPYRDDSWHGNYAGIGDFTGLSEGEHRLEEVERRVKEVIEVTSMPVEPGTSNLRDLYEPLRRTFEVEHKGKCNVLFKLREYYSYDYGSFTKAILARKFRQAPRRKVTAHAYDPNEFIVALHIRVGDIQPTSEEYFIRVLSQILPELRGLPHRVHAFAEDRTVADFPRLSAFLGDRLAFHGHMKPFESFFHLTQPHVLVMSASGFSQFSAILGTKALQFSPPSRELFPLKFCPPGAVCCESDGTFGHDGHVRLHWRKERWLASRRRKDDARQLAEILAGTDSIEATSAE